MADSIDVEANPYAVIIQRNAFHLNPPPPLPEANKAPPPDLPLVKLSGFLQMGNQWKVLLAVQTRNPDPKATPSSVFLALAEGDKEKAATEANQFVVEVVKIYPVEEKVDIINSGTAVTLSMKNNGFESAAPSPAQVHLSPAGGAPPARKGMRAAPMPVWRTETNKTEEVPGEGAKTGSGPSPAGAAPPPAGVAPATEAAPSLSRASAENPNGIIFGGAP